MSESLGEVVVDGRRGRVYEHGWQSWSPTTTYPVMATSHRPRNANDQTMCCRPGRPGPEVGFQGEGLLAVDPGTGGPVEVFAAATAGEVPSIRAQLDGERLVVTADGPVERLAPAGGLEHALATWADRRADAEALGPIRPAPTVWCSWYQYFTEVTEADVLENVAEIAALDLPVDVVQIDDGWQAEIGDWRDLSDRFGSLAQLVERIAATGRRAGIWVAPFLVGAKSEVARRHPGWLVAGADAGRHWGQQLGALDVGNPQAADHLQDVFGRLRELGFDYFKLDFVYAGALAGVEAYRHGLGLIRAAVGDDAYVVGCGAPILPSVGLVDAMRVSPDIDTRVEVAGDLSRPSLAAAALSTVGRAWQHGRFWVNDPDCLLARPAMPERQRWAAIVERYGGLRASSDRIRDLDGWGLATTRRLLGEVPPPVPFAIPA
jgi:alpha-galactosidase